MLLLYITIALLFLVVYIVWSTRTLEAQEKAYLDHSLSLLKKRVIVVTGSTSGIGEKLVELLAGAGAHVYLCYRSLERGRASLARVLAAHPHAKVTLLELDVTSPASVRKASEVLLAAHPAIDGLVANAGVMPLERYNWAAIARALCWGRLGSFLETGRPCLGSPHFLLGGTPGSLIETHVIGHLALVQALLPSLKAAPGGGRVVWTASRAADTHAIHWDALEALSSGSGHTVQPSKQQQQQQQQQSSHRTNATLAPPPLPSEAYAEAKAVQELASRALSRAWGVMSLSVCPGFVETGITPPFFSLVSPMWRQARVLAPSMTLTTERGASALVGALATPRGVLRAMGEEGSKWVLWGGGIAPSKEGWVEGGGGVEGRAWGICLQWLGNDVWGGGMGMGMGGREGKKGYGLGSPGGKARSGSTGATKARRNVKQ